MKAYICSVMIGVGAVLLSSARGEAQGLFSETQTFDTATSSALGGWVGLNTTSEGNAYGFSNTDSTAGTSPAGEAGGTIARTVQRSFYGDLTLDGVLTLDDAITASGEFNFIEQTFNNNIQIGHFDATATTLVNTVGISVSEAHSTTADFRMSAFISLSDGRSLFSSPLLLNRNIARTWSYSWDPTAGTAGVLTVSISGPGGGTVTLALTPGERAQGASLNAFGLSSGAVGEASTTNTARLYIDNVTYTIAGDLSLCESELSLCEADLAQATADADQDGRRDLDDDCPNTAPSSAVDQSGCSLAQFCAAVNATTREGALVCKNSDWRNDEPLMEPEQADCTVDKRGRGQEDDLCVPR